MPVPPSPTLRPRGVTAFAVAYLLIAAGFLAVLLAGALRGSIPPRIGPFPIGAIVIGVLWIGATGFGAWRLAP